MRGLCAMIVLTGGCAGLGVANTTGRPVTAAHSENHDLRVLDFDSPLRARKHVPVLSTPEVFAAYVPSHVRDDVLIGEHWIFFKLGEAEWFVERMQDPDPPADAPADPARLKLLQTVDWKGAVVPHRSTN